MAAPQPGTDGALAMAMGHVFLKEFFVDRQTETLVASYVKRYTDLPFLVALDEAEGEPGTNVRRSADGGCTSAVDRPWLEGGQGRRRASSGAAIS